MSELPDIPNTRFPQMMANQMEAIRVQQLRQVAKLIRTAQTLPVKELVAVLTEQGWEPLEIVEILEEAKY